MFSLKIVDTDAFLDMPQSSQLLYFHLSMRADDDGFVPNPKKIMRVIGSNEDDLKVLFTKRFVLPFESGVCVIKHWKIHNYIKKDHYVATQYVKELEMLQVDPQTRKYQLKSERRQGLQDRRLQNGPQNVSKMPPQVRLGKVRLENTSETQNAFPGKEVNEVINLFKEVNPMIQKLFGSPPQRSAAERMLKEFGREKLEVMIAALPKINSQQYWPKSTTPVQLENNIAIYIAKKSELESPQKSAKNKIAIIK